VKITLRAAASPGHTAAAKAIITTLPAKGVLVDSLGGVVTGAPYTLPSPEVTFQPAPHGGAVQADPMQPKLKVPGTKRLTQKCDEPLSSFAFKSNLRRYSMAAARPTPLSRLRRATAPPPPSALTSPSRQGLTRSR
jgi:hypothetical protein